MANITVPDVTVEQIFETSNPTLLAPVLPTVLIGQCRQVEYRQSAGEYDPDFSVVLNYPGLKTAAVVSLSSVQVYLSNSDGVFELDSTSYAATADDITVPTSIALDVRVVENSQTGTTDGIFFTDENINFNKVFRALSDTSSIVVSSPSDNQKSFSVQSILTGNVLLIKDSENGQIRDSGVFTSITQSTSTVITGTDLAVYDWVLGAAAQTLTFASTYLSGATSIASEPQINSTTILPGDYIVVFVGTSERFVRKISSASSSGVTLESAVPEAITVGCSYKIFHPVLAKGTNLSGDYVIAKHTGSTENYYAEVYSIASMNTLSLTTALTNINDSVSATNWVLADSYEIWRGARRSTDVNVYDGFLTTTNYTADVLVSYISDRNDLNEDTEAITGVDDIDSILGPAVPENPLAFAAYIHSQVSNELFYVIGVSADTKIAHQRSLEVLEAKEVYSLVPLSQDLEILALYKPHVDTMSQPEEKMERSAIISRDIYISEDILVDGTNAQLIGGTDSTGTKAVLGLINSFASNTSSAAAISTVTLGGVGYNAAAGDMLVYFEGSDAAATRSFATITAVDSGLGQIVFAPAHTLTLGNTIHIVSNTYADAINNTIDLNGVKTQLIGGTLNLLDSNSEISTSVVVTNVTSISSGLGYNYQYMVVENDDFGTRLKSQIFSATTTPLSKEEQAQYIRDYAASILDRRVIHVWCPRQKLSYSPVSDPTTEQSSILPGYYMATAIAAMKSTNAPSQPFTNLPIPLATQVYYTNAYFKPTYLDMIATGGNYIIVQTTPDSLPYCRHQLTTDTTSIETREYSILTAIDWFAKYIRTNLRPYIGRFNITANYLAQLKGVANSTIKDTVDIKKYLASARIIKLYQSPTQPDEVYLDIDIGVLYPANKIRVRIYI